MEHEETRAQRRQSAQFTALGLRAAARSPIRRRAISLRKGPTGRGITGTILSGIKTFGSSIGETALTMARGNVPIPIGGTGTAMQLRAIGRQQLARVPGPVKVGAAIATGAGVAQAVEVATGRSPARIIHDVGSAAFPFSGQPQAPRRRSVANGNGLRVGQELPPSHVVVRTWQTFPGGPVFARLADGHIAVQKKDGTIKHFRPYRPVVIPRKWNARSMSRVATALKRQRKTATKILKITGGVPTRTVRSPGRAHRSVDVD